MGENPSISAVFEILKAACLAPTTIPHSKSIKNTFHPILMLGRLANVCVVKCTELLPWNCIERLNMSY